MSLLQNVILTGGRQPSAGAKKSGNLEVNPVPNQQILLTIQSSVVIVVQLISRTNAWLIESPASNVTELVIMPLNADLAVAVLVLSKIQGNLPGFVVRQNTPW